MKLLNTAIDVSFTADEAAQLGYWIQWEMAGTIPTEIYDLLKDLGRCLVPEVNQD